VEQDEWEYMLKRKGVKDYFQIPSGASANGLRKASPMIAAAYGADINPYVFSTRNCSRWIFMSVFVALSFFKVFLRSATWYPERASSKSFNAISRSDIAVLLSVMVACVCFQCCGTPERTIAIIGEKTSGSLITKIQNLILRLSRKTVDIGLAHFSGSAKLARRLQMPLRARFR
jgi:hypothetical protein